MSDKNHNNNHHRRELNEAVRLREKRRESWAKTGERPLWKNLSASGALGWLIVTPILLGALLGRWLDQTFNSGIFWSGALIFLGAAFGGYLAWQRITRS